MTPLARLGVVHDIVIARELGVTRSRVSQLRRAAGIAPIVRRASTLDDLDALVAWLADQWEPVSTCAIRAHFGWGRYAARHRLDVVVAAGRVLSVGRGAGRGCANLWVAA